MKESSCTSPPLIEAIFTLSIQLNFFPIANNSLSTPAYNAQALAAQYA
jgi:hypothetical protein